jgi:hypothetical protein
LFIRIFQSLPKKRCFTGHRQLVEVLQGVVGLSSWKSHRRPKQWDADCAVTGDYS